MNRPTFDLETWLAMLEDDKGGTVASEGGRYLNSSMAYLQTTLGGPSAWMKLDHTTLLAYLYNEEEGEPLVEAVGGRIIIEDGHDGPYPLWICKLTLSIAERPS